MHIFTTKYGNHIDLGSLRDRLNVACGNGKTDLATLQQARDIVETLRYPPAKQESAVLTSLKWLVKMLEDDPDGAPLLELYSAHIAQAKAAIKAEQKTITK